MKNSQDNFDKVEGLILPDFKTYCKGMVIEVVQYLYKDTQVDLQNRIEFRNGSIHIRTTDF